MSTDYTPSAFPHITFIPQSIFKTLSILEFLVLYVLTSFVFFYAIAGLIVLIIEYGLAEFYEYCISSLIIVLIVIYLWIILGWPISYKIKCKKYAIFVEKTPMPNISGKLHRIGKECKLGLLDARWKKIRLMPCYDSIEQFDNKHLLIRQHSKVGLYSLRKKKIIIPIKYDSISQFTNYVAEAKWSEGIDHYDIAGNLIN